MSRLDANVKKTTFTNARGPLSPATKTGPAPNPLRQRSARSGSRVILASENREAIATDRPRCVGAGNPPA